MANNHPLSLRADSVGPKWVAEIDPDAAPVDLLALDRAFVAWLLSIEDQASDEGEHAPSTAPPTAAPAALTRRRERKTSAQKKSCAQDGKPRRSSQTQKVPSNEPRQESGTEQAQQCQSDR
jgi:hypothetical protein